MTRKPVLAAAMGVLAGFALAVAFGAGGGGATPPYELKVWSQAQRGGNNVIQSGAYRLNNLTGEVVIIDQNGNSRTASIR